MTINEDTDRSNKRSIFAFHERKGHQPQRLKKRRQFMAIAALQQKIVTPAFIVQLDKCADESHGPHYGFTVTKMVGNAVVRNRVKRKLRELVRLIIDPLNKKNRNMVFIGRRAALSRSMTKLERDAVWALHEMERLYGDQ